MKKVVGVFIIVMMFMGCAKASDGHIVNTDVLPPETHRPIPYEAIRKLPIGEYCIFNLAYQKAKVVRVEGGYLFIVATSDWSDAGITSMFIPFDQF